MNLRHRASSSCGNSSSVIMLPLAAAAYDLGAAIILSRCGRART
jgi:hypothetical protein